MASLYRRRTIEPPVPDTPAHPVTPDGRYFVVRGRLWRMSNPALPADARQRWVDKLMSARRDVGAALRAQDAQGEKAARAAVDRAKRALGERGPVWWTDDAPDCNRRLVRNTDYAVWYAGLMSRRTTKAGEEN